MPPPQPTSTTCSPGCNLPTLNGLPVPAKEAIVGSGMPSSQVSAYPSTAASGRPTRKWNPCSGSCATSAYSAWIARRKPSRSTAGVSTVCVMVLPFGFLRSVALFVRGAVGFHRKSSCAPLRKSRGKSPHLEALALQQLGGLIRVHAVRAAAIGDDLAVARYFGQASLQLGDRDGAGAGDVALAVLELWPHVQQHDIAFLYQPLQLIEVDRRQTRAVGQEGFD